MNLVPVYDTEGHEIDKVSRDAIMISKQQPILSPWPTKTPKRMEVQNKKGLRTLFTFNIWIEEQQRKFPALVDVADMEFH